MDKKEQEGVRKPVEGAQKPEESGGGPDFICDPVPYEYRKYYEGRKGRHHVAAGLLAAAVIFGGVFLDRLPVLLGYAGEFSETVSGTLGLGIGGNVLMRIAFDMLTSLIVYFLPLFGLVKWQSYLTGKTYEKKIRECGKEWYAGTFKPDFLMIEDRAGVRKFYYYNDITSVKETADSYSIAGAGESLIIPKMYLNRDGVRSVRHHLMRYCGECYEHNFSEEEEGLRLVLFRNGTEPGRESGKDYIRYVSSRHRFYYTGTKMWLLGLCLCYLIRLAMGDVSFFSIEARAGLVLAVGLIPVSKGIVLLLAKRAVRKSRQWMQKGIPVILEIGKSGFYFQNSVKQHENSRTWMSWREIKEVCEGKKFIVIGKAYIDKKIFTEEHMGQIRALCQKYAVRKYHYVEAEPQTVREIVKAFVPIFCYVVLMVIVFAVQNGWETRTADRGQIAEFGGGWQEEEQQESDAAVSEQGSREPIYVLTPDKAALHLTAAEIRIDECYSHNETNYTSRFFIDAHGILYGASANEHGELGNGTTEADLTAKGFYRETEVARDVCHVSLGAEFMVYLTDSGVLMGTGNLPTEDSPIVTTAALELMRDVQYVKCSDYGMIVLKEDGTVWCAGRLCDREGNVIREYSGFEQVMDHAVYADAGVRTMAVIRSDGSLWMWGDNSSQQCGVSSLVAEAFDEPVQVKEKVRMVWLDRLAFSSEQEHQGYLGGVPDPQAQYSSNVFWTYILQEDGQVYACGRDGTFVEVTVIEE